MENQTQNITLPDGNEVSISLIPQPSWLVNNTNEFIDPKRLVPDPNQPRRHINAEKLAQLVASIRTAGVREPITVTPLSLSPWIPADTIESPDAYFRIVSGHRRWNAVRQAEIGAIPCRIKIYKNEKEYRLDASLLNKGRDDLSELDEAFEILALKEHDGYTYSQLADAFGISVAQVSLRLNLTRLSPGIQELISSELQDKKRIPTTVAQTLGSLEVPSVDDLIEYTEKFGTDEEAGKNFDVMDDTERRFFLQEVLLGHVTRHGYPAARAVSFIKERKVNQNLNGSSQKVTHHQPKSGKGKEVIRNFLSQIQGSVLMDWKPDRFTHIFNLNSYEEVGAFIQNFADAKQDLDAIMDQLRRIQRTKKPTAQYVIDAMKQKTA